MPFTSIYTIRYLIEYPDTFNSFRSRDNITISCDNCQTLSTRIVKNIKGYIVKGSKHSFCSRNCQTLYHDTTIDIPCTNCHNIFKRRKAQITDGNNFCGKSCSASYNNRVTPKRKKKVLNICSNVECDRHVRNHRSDLCECHYSEKRDLFKNMTLHEYQNKDSVKDKHPSWVNSHVRNFCRSWNKDLTEKPCKVCAYSKHVELCHKIPVSFFPKNTVMKTVNNKHNVIQLCRNCHWEFDHGLLYFYVEGSDISYAPYSNIIFTLIDAIKRYN